MRTVCEGGGDDGDESSENEGSGMRVVKVNGREDERRGELTCVW